MYSEIPILKWLSWLPHLFPYFFKLSFSNGHVLTEIGTDVSNVFTMVPLEDLKRFNIHKKFLLYCFRSQPIFLLTSIKHQHSLETKVLTNRYILP